MVLIQDYPKLKTWFCSDLLSPKFRLITHRLEKKSWQHHPSCADSNNFFSTFRKIKPDLQIEYIIVVVAIFHELPCHVQGEIWFFPAISFNQRPATKLFQFWFYRLNSKSLQKISRFGNEMGAESPQVLCHPYKPCKPTWPSCMALAHPQLLVLPAKFLTDKEKLVHVGWTA